MGFFSPPSCPSQHPPLPKVLLFALRDITHPCTSTLSPLRVLRGATIPATNPVSPSPTATSPGSPTQSESGASSAQRAQCLLSPYYWRQDAFPEHLEPGVPPSPPPPHTAQTPSHPHGSSTTSPPGAMRGLWVRTVSRVCVCVSPHWGKVFSQEGPKGQQDMWVPVPSPKLLPGPGGAHRAEPVGTGGVGGGDTTTPEG